MTLNVWDISPISSRKSTFTRADRSLEEMIDFMAPAVLARGPVRSRTKRKRSTTAAAHAAAVRMTVCQEMRVTSR